MRSTLEAFGILILACAICLVIIFAAIIANERFAVRDRGTLGGP